MNFRVFYFEIPLYRSFRSFGVHLRSSALWRLFRIGAPNTGFSTQIFFHFIMVLTLFWRSPSFFRSLASISYRRTKYRFFNLLVLWDYSQQEFSTLIFIFIPAQWLIFYFYAIMHSDLYRKMSQELTSLSIRYQFWVHGYSISLYFSSFVVGIPQLFSFIRRSWVTVKTYYVLIFPFDCVAFWKKILKKKKSSILKYIRYYDFWDYPILLPFKMGFWILNGFHTQGNPWILS